MVRHVTLPWKALQSVLMKIDALQGRKDDYLALQKAGENLVEVRPNGVLQRSPQKAEWFSINRLKDFELLGDPQSHFLYGIPLSVPH